MSGIEWLWGLVDWGDAPEPYPTLIASGGARHSSGGPRLGAEMDTESDGQPSSGADGDDLDGTPDDEDGVTIAARLNVGQTNVTVVVKVQDAPGGATLDAWLDFNRDGTWESGAERIADGLSVTNGDNTLRFDVSEWAKLGSTYARFRLSTDGVASPGGAALDGEVEDYHVALVGDWAAEEHAIAAGFAGACSVHAADINDDGNADVVGAAADDDLVAWWENVGGTGTSWVQRTVAAGLAGACAVVSADVDDDGALDVVAVASGQDTIGWWRNADRTGTTWTAHVLSGVFTGACAVAAEDVDRDGDIDIVAAASNANAVTWWENTDRTGAIWTAHVLSTTFTGACSVAVGDLDCDGDRDVIAVAAEANAVGWWRNEDYTGRTWTAVSVDAAFGGARDARVADINRDGQPDIVAAGGNADAFAWWQNLGGGTNWQKHAAGGGYDGAAAVCTADINLDGAYDLVGASAGDGFAGWFRNANATGTSWAAYMAADAWPGACTVDAADLDGDGDADILGGSRTSGDVAWWENTMIHRSAEFPEELLMAHPTREPHSMATGDLDGDGDLDLVWQNTSDWGGGAAACIYWLRNEDRSGTNWTPIRVTESYNGHILVLDLDGDGDLDLAHSHVRAHAVRAYENDNGLGTSWTHYTLGELSGVMDRYGAMPIDAADVDGDGDPDIIVDNNKGSHQFTKWLENPGTLTNWVEHTVTSELTSHRTYGADMDGDGDIDVAGRVGDYVVWYENVGGAGTNWTRHPVAAPGDLREARPADMDRDGDMDMLACRAGYGDAGIIVWFENLDGTGTNWSMQAVGANKAYQVWVADLDLDGDVDVLSARADRESHGGGAQRAAQWFENLDGQATSWTRHALQPGTHTCMNLLETGDFDLDGDPDVALVTGTWSGNDLDILLNQAAHFELPTTNVAPSYMGLDVTNAVLAIGAQHLGRAGEADAELATLALLFEETGGDPLTTTEADNLLAGLWVYRDNGSGTFEADADTLVMSVTNFALADGVQTVELDDGDPRARFAVSNAAVFFVCLAFEEDGYAHSPDRCIVTHLTENPLSVGPNHISTAEDVSNDSELRIRYLANVSTGPLIAQPTADLGVAKSAPATRAAGTVLTYTITVTNAGPHPARNVEVVDTLPAGVSPGGTLITNLGTLASGAVATVTIDVTVSTETRGVIENTAVLSSTAYDGNSLNDTGTVSTLIVPVADLGIYKDSPDTIVGVGWTIDYWITFNNAGPHRTCATVRDLLPEGLSVLHNSVFLDEPDKLLHLDFNTGPFTNGAPVRDLTGKGHDGVLRTDNGATDKAVPGKYGGSGVGLDRSADYVECPSFDITNSFTLSLWVNVTADADGQAFIGKNSASGDNQLVFGIYSGKRYQVVMGSQAHYDGALQLGWQHLAVVGKEQGGNTLVKVYRDGAVLWSATLNGVVGDVSGGHGWLVGMEYDGGSKGDYLGGHVDEVMIFNRALSGDEVASLYSRTTEFFHVTAAGEIEADLVGLAAGTVGGVTFTAQVGPAVEGWVTNTASIAADAMDTNAANDTAAVRAFVVGLPLVDITNANVTVGSEVSTMTIGGTDNEWTLSPMNWSNTLNGASGSFSAVSPWTIPDIPLDFGVNTIIVSGWNGMGTFCADTVTVTRVTWHIGDSPAHYARANNPSPLWPYTNWATAASVIQDAVDAAGPGGLVLVTNGMYGTGGVPAPGHALSNRVCITRAVTVRSVNGAALTTIAGEADPAATNGPHAVRCAYLAAGAVLHGFTLTDGHTHASGDATNDMSGGGVFFDGGGTLSNCVVTACTGSRAGGGAYCRAGGTLDSCLLHGNRAGDGGGIYCDDMGGRLSNVTLSRNTATNRGGGVYCGLGGWLRNTIVYGNTADTGGADYHNEGPEWRWDYTYCCAPTNPGGIGNITNDPQFVDAGSGDFRLQAASRCIDAGSMSLMPAGPDLDGTPRPLDGDGRGVVEADMGCYEYLLRSADSDGDTMTDGFEHDYGLDASDASDALGDPDGDDFTSLEEYIADTDPTDPDDYFRVTGVSQPPPTGEAPRPGAGVIYLTHGSTPLPPAVHFDSSAERVYLMMGCSDLVGNVWRNVPGTGPRPGVDGPDAMRDTNAPPRGPFYRLKVSLPE